MPSTIDESAASAAGEAGVSSASPDVQDGDVAESTEIVSIFNNDDAQALVVLAARRKVFPAER